MLTRVKARSFLLGLMALTSFALASCALLARLAPYRIDIPPDYMGITHAGYSGSAAEYDLIRILGAKMSRMDFSWDLIEAQQSVFDFSRYDAIVDTAITNGIDILAILDYDVPWIHANHQVQKYISPDKMQDWLAYVSAVVAHFQGRVKAYEIWNEPNGAYWKGSIHEFAALTRQTAEVIRAHDLSAVIIAGAFFRSPNEWAKTMIADGAFQQVDAISFHPYASAAETVTRMSYDFMAYVRSLGFTGKFWITEIGFTTKGIYPWTVSDAAYPAHLVRTVTLLSVSGADKLVWYTLTDKYLANRAPKGESITSIAEAYFGVAYPDYSPKNGAYAYAAVSNVVQGSTYVPDIVQNHSLWRWIRVFPYVMADRKLAVVAWAGLPARIEFSEAVSGTLVAIDGPGSSFSGRILRLSGKPIVLVTRETVDLSRADHLVLHIKAF